MAAAITHMKPVVIHIVQSFFIWSMPLCVIVLNILKNRDTFGVNVLYALIIGLFINIVWDIAMLRIQKKEYHKNLL